MNAQDQQNNESTTRTESASAPVWETSTRPEHFHTRLLHQFQASTAAEGEAALQRWGLALFHSMSDEDVQKQREALGMPARDAYDFYNQGCSLAARQDFKAAAKSFQEAINRQPDLSEAYYNKALALEQSGDPAGAKAAWQDYLSRFGDSEEAADIRQHLTTLG